MEIFGSVKVRGRDGKSSALPQRPLPLHQMMRHIHHPMPGAELLQYTVVEPFTVIVEAP
jgi:hypothetical protein